MNRRWNTARSLLLAFAITTGTLPAQNTTATQPDNTKVNKRDRSTSQPTADQGKNNKSDLQIMKEIRRAVMKDKSLSTYAHNVKIISKGGMVTLKGPVHTEDEKKTIEQAASSVAGDGKVTNQITVKGDSKK